MKSLTRIVCIKIMKHFLIGIQFCSPMKSTEIKYNANTQPMLAINANYGRYDVWLYQKN